MRNFNSPFLDVVLRVPTWSQSSFWKLLYQSSFIHLFHEGPIQMSLLYACFSFPPQNEWFLSSCCHEMLLYQSTYWVLPDLTTASEHACVIHRRLRSPWFIPKTFLSVFCALRAALYVDWSSVSLLPAWGFQIDMLDELWV